MEAEKEDKKQSDDRVYEVGFLLLPSLSEVELSEEFSAIKSTVEKDQGAVIGEAFPISLNLSYTMMRSSGSQSQKYNSAYFGWIKIEISTDSLSQIETYMSANSRVIRFMIVKTVRESTTVSIGRVSQTTKEQELQDKSGQAISPQISEEIDKSIDKLVVE